MLRPIHTECFVSLADPKEPAHVFDDGIVIRVEDDGAGPYLVIRGRVEGMQGGAFPLEAGDIDRFAGICKAFLAQAEGA